MHRTWRKLEDDKVKAEAALKAIMAKDAAKGESTASSSTSAAAAGLRKHPTQANQATMLLMLSCLGSLVQGASQQALVNQAVEELMAKLAAGSESQPTASSSGSGRKPAAAESESPQEDEMPEEGPLEEHPAEDDDGVPQGGGTNMISTATAS